MPAIPWFALVRSKWLYFGLLIALLGIQTLRLHHAQHTAASYKLAAETLRKSYEAAQATATAKAIAAKLAEEARSRANAEKADADYQTALARAQRASDAYARLHPAPRRAASGPAAPADDHSPQSPDRSSQDAVVVGRDDFDILVENSVRLEAAHNWAKTLNQPVPVPAFGSPPNQP